MNCFRRRFSIASFADHGLVGCIAFAASLLSLSGVIGLGWDAALPLGARPVTTVPLFNLWTYQHTFEFVSGGADSYWCPEIFAPRRGMLAMSDPQPLTAAVYTFLRCLMSPVAAYNTLALIVLTTNGIAAGWMAVGLGCCRPAAIAATIGVVWLPFVAAEIGVLQMTVLAPVIWTTGLLARFHRTAVPIDAGLIGIGISACYLTSGYWGLWLALMSFVSGLALLRREHLRRGPLVGIVAAAAIVIVCCGPFVFYQQTYVGDYHWDGAYIDSLAASVVDYVRVGDESVAAKMPWTLPAGPWPIRLYPGALLVIAAIVGSWQLLRETSGQTWEANCKSSSMVSRRWLFVTLLMIQVALVLSFGRVEALGDGSPMNLLQSVVPGLDKLRSPYRLGMFVAVLMLPLAAIGIDRWWRWSPKFAAIVIMLGLAEIVPFSGFSAGATDISAVLDAPPAWCEFLQRSKNAEEPDSDGRIVHLPMSGSEAGYNATCRAMLLQSVHGRPMVDGYSGFFPPEVTRLRTQTLRFPDGPSAMALLRAGTRWIVVDRSRMTRLQLSNLDRLPKLLRRRYVDEDADVVVYRFTGEAIASVRDDQL